MAAARPRSLSLLLLIPIFLCAGLACPFELGPTLVSGTASQPASEPVAILLEIINESGVDAVVTATFFAHDVQVRETVRRLAADGAGSTDLVVPTRTQRIHVVARQAAPITPAAREGDVLADEEIIVTSNISPGDTITFVIPPGFSDCNGNGVNDAIDIAHGASLDCDQNGIPDECDPSRPVVVVIGEVDRILATDQDGSPPSTLVTLSSYGLGSLRKLDLDLIGQGLFFTQTVSVSDGTVERIPLTGGTPVSLIAAQEEIGGIGLAAADGLMFWSSTIASPAGARVASALLDGSSPGDVITGLQGVVAKPHIDPVHAKLYFTYNPDAGNVDFIDRADLDGSNITPIISNAVDPRDLDTWPEVGLLVWAEYGSSGGVFVADLDGNAAAKIITQASVTGVAIDRENCKVYWCSEGSPGFNDGFVERAWFDGSHVERVIDGLNAPQDVAVYKAP